MSVVFTLKEVCRMVKRWGVVFTCLASRAIHLETSAAMDTSSYINALRRFLAIRGPVRWMRSDRGSNFVGARHEFEAELGKMDFAKVQDAMKGYGCDLVEFKMNPPHASNFGGVWERQIKTIRSVLNALMLETGSQLDDEELRTVMAEVSAIVNSRPLSTETVNDPSLVPLSPNRLLTMKSKVLYPPPGEFVREDLYAVKRWRRVQHILNCFWERWRKEYLSQLQSRQKWINPKRNLQIGDLVLVRDDAVIRSMWKMGRVRELKMSSDQLVRSVTLEIGSRDLDKRGRRIGRLSTLERPANKLVLLVEAE